MDASSESPYNGQELSERRTIRSQYLAVKNQVCGDGEDIANVDSSKFCSMIREVENLHQNVHRPREQVADAEALLDITTSLVTAVKSQRSGPTPSDFVDAIIRLFGVPGRDCINANHLSKESWERIGMSVSHVFMSGQGFLTMNGPMTAEVKSGKSVARRKRTRPTQSSRPEDVGETEGDPAKKTDTDKNMLTMFTILRKQKQTKLECLVLNRESFAQTIENIFALSFLVKDGRVQITVDEDGHHFVSPRNAPAATSIMSGDVSYNHFIFRFDFKDWKAMKEMVAPGEELMPHRLNSVNSASRASNSNQDKSKLVNYATLASNGDQVNSRCCNTVRYATLVSSDGQVNFGSSEQDQPSTPIKTLTRNRGLVTTEESGRNDSQDGSSLEEELSNRSKCRRLNDSAAV